MASFKNDFPCTLENKTYKPGNKRWKLQVLKEFTRYLLMQKQREKSSQWTKESQH